MRYVFFLLTMLITPSVTAAQEISPLDVYGVWLTEKQNSKIEVTDCGNNTPCGKIIWVDDPAPEALRDTNNKDESLRVQPILGLTILEGFIAKKDQWKKGKIYDPESGKTYGAKLRRLPDGVLQVKGCLGPICQTQLWTLAEPT